MAALLIGCSNIRPPGSIGDAVMGAGGAYIAHELSDGSPAATAAGAAAGILVSKGVQFAVKKESAKAFMSGYDKGRSDAVKQQYWLYVGLQRHDGQSAHVRLYPVQLPEQCIDGVIFQPTTKYLRIEE